MKVVHFVVDDKFIPFIQSTFEQAFPGGNEYRVYGDPKKPLKFIKSGPNVRIKGASYWTDEAITNELKEFDCLVIHWMNPCFMEGVLRAPDELLISWVGWGGDYYYLIEPYFGNLLLPTTHSWMERVEHERNKPHHRIAAKARRILHNPQKIIPYIKNRIIANQDVAWKSDITIHDVINRIDLLWVNPEEMNMIEMALPKFNGCYHRICYYSSEEIFAIGPSRMDGQDILMGNSATATNNHLELFDVLAQIDLGDRLLFAPLSYGDTDYGNEITRIGKKKFGKRFIPIREYLPITDYYDTISSCGIAIMNHVRQQAGTTIATALYKGAKVFLRNENPVMSFYRKMGMSLFSIQDDLTSDTNALYPLDEGVKNKHQFLLNNYWSHEVAVNAALELKCHADHKRSLKA